MTDYLNERLSKPLSRCKRAILTITVIALKRWAIWCCQSAASAARLARRIEEGMAYDAA